MHTIIENKETYRIHSNSIEANLNNNRLIALHDGHFERLFNAIKANSEWQQDQ